MGLNYPQDALLSKVNEEDMSQPVEYQGYTSLVQEYHCDILFTLF